MQGQDWYDPRDWVYNEVRKPELIAVATKQINENVATVMELIERTQEQASYVPCIAEMALNYSIDNISSVLLGHTLGALNGSLESQAFKEQRSVLYFSNVGPALKIVPKVSNERAWN